MKHFILVAILVAVLTVGVGMGLSNLQLMPDLASAQGVFIDQLFHKHVWAISFLFSLIVGFMLYSIVVFRRREEGESGDHFEGNTPLEIVWTILPLATVLYFAYLGAVALAETRRADPNAYNVTAVGQQWSWRFDYTDYGFSSDELRLPANRQTLILTKSLDVIHSFWIPEFRVKQDALPGEGMERELRITPTKTGTFKVRCAELCGTRHAYMLADVIVMEPDAFDQWVQEQMQGPGGTAEERGAEWYQQFGCVACHSTDGSPLVGPTWKGLYGEEVTLADGSTVIADEAYLRESILDPQAKIVQGFENVIMPPIGASMTPEQVDDVIAFIKSLGTEDD